MRPADLNRLGFRGWKGKIFAVKVNVNLARKRFRFHDILLGAVAHEPSAHP
jgi:hypothetical protein